MGCYFSFFFFGYVSVFLFCFSWKSILKFQINFWMLLLCFNALGCFLTWNDEMANSSLLITFCLFDIFSFIFVSKMRKKASFYLFYTNIFSSDWKFSVNLNYCFSFPQSIEKQLGNNCQSFCGSAQVFQLVVLLRMLNSLLPIMPKFTRIYFLNTVFFAQQNLSLQSSF